MRACDPLSLRLPLSQNGRGGRDRLIRALGVQSVDVSDLSRAEPLLLMLVAREGVPLYEENPGDFACFVSLAARRFADTRKFREMERREIHDFLARERPAP